MRVWRGGGGPAAPGARSGSPKVPPNGTASVALFGNFGVSLRAIKVFGFVICSTVPQKLRADYEYRNLLLISHE